MKLFNSHVRWSFFPRFEQSFIESFFISDKPPLIIYFFFILYQTLSSNLGFFFLNLFGDEILKSQISSFLEEVLNIFEFFLAISKSTQGNFALIIGFQLD